MLYISELSVSGRKRISLLNDVSLPVNKGECIALTGPSGSGKTTLLRTILGISSGDLQVESGRIMLDDRDILSMPEKQRRLLCRRHFGFIPQNPMTAFFRSAKIGGQMTETFSICLKIGKSEAQTLAEACLRQVNLPETERIMKAYPDQLSGGMLQRVAIAILLGIRPDYILADEPTSALDKENRALVLSLLRECQKEAGILFVSHDTEAMEALSSHTYVLQDGRIVESQPTQNLFDAPIQQWTRAFAEAARNHREGGGQWKRLK